MANKLVVIAVAVTLALPVRAAPEPGQVVPFYAETIAQPGSVGELDRLQQQTLIAEKQKKLRELQGQAGVDAMMGTRASAVSAGSLPSFDLVQGIAPNLVAGLTYPSGQTISARKGDHIPGGFLIESISVRQVVVSKNGEKTYLSSGMASLPSPAMPVMPLLPGMTQGFTMPDALSR